MKTQRTNQPVFDFNGRLFEIWDNHIKRIDENSNIKDRNALFVDTDGYHMSGDSYEKYFYNLKVDFIKYLSQEGHQQSADK